jgi:hypothetical protein
MSFTTPRLTAVLAAVVSALLSSGCDSSPDAAPSAAPTSIGVITDGPEEPTTTAHEEPTAGAPTADDAPPTPAADPPAAATPAESPTPATLPPDQLTPLVPGPADVPAGMELTGGGVSGPVDAGEVSSLSSYPEAAEKALAANGFTSGYQVQYVDPASGALVTATVARFAAPAGAKAHFARDVAEARSEAKQVPVNGLGDEAAASSFSVPEGDVDEVYGLRFRKGATWWVLSTAAPGKADRALARRLAETLLQRAG